MEANSFNIVNDFSGMNNQVVEFSCTPETNLVVKFYNPTLSRNRDRLNSEWSFISKLWEEGSRCIPKPILKNKEHRFCVYSKLSGKKMDPESINSSHIIQCANFICDINPIKNIPTFENATEACFSAEHHFLTVKNRVKSLSFLDESAPFYKEAKKFITNDFDDLWQTVTLEVETFVQTEKGKQYSAYLSPSDFGFHNILNYRDKLSFFDFEYAGKDDLAKLVNDFFGCPQIPVSEKYRKEFITILSKHFNFSDDFKLRCLAFKNLYKIKWICIILNDFLLLGDKQRSFSNNSSREKRCYTQLEKAKSLLKFV